MDIDLELVKRESAEYERRQLEILINSIRVDISMANTAITFVGDIPEKLRTLDQKRGLYYATYKKAVYSKVLTELELRGTFANMHDIESLSIDVSETIIPFSCLVAKFNAESKCCVDQGV